MVARLPSRPPIRAVTGAPNGAIWRLRQIATRTFVPNSYDTDIKQMMSRTRRFARDNIAGLRLVIPNFYVDASGAAQEVGIGGSTTVTASIEYPSGTFTRVTFGGENSGTIANLSLLTSDMATVSIPDGAEFFVRIYWASSTGIVFSSTAANDPSHGDAFDYGASGISDRTMGGSISDKGSANNNFHPLAVLGMTTRPAVMIIGDSRAVGRGDSYSDTTGDIGEIARSIGGDMAYLNTSVSGDLASDRKTNGGLRDTMSQYCDVAICELGINDLTNSRTAVQLAADLEAVRQNIGLPMWVTTKPPVSSSSDDWATLGNQTTHSSNAQRVLHNNAVRAGLPGMRGFFEVADQVESARDSGKWIVDGNADYATADGVHETNAAYLLIQSSSAVTL